MKKIVSLIALFVFAGFLFETSANAAQVSRNQFKAAFGKLTQEGKKAQQKMLNAPQSKSASSKFSIAPMQEIDPVVIGETTYECGVMVWFQLADGRFVNPTKHKWQRKERFKVFIRVPVPVYIGLYQNYPEDRPPSRQVYPDAAYPDTFCVVPPGVDFALPVDFEMDDDLRDEIMSMVVTRIDDQNVIQDVPVRVSIDDRPDSTTSTGAIIIHDNHGTIGIGGEMKASPKVYGYMQKQNDDVLLQKNTKAKFAITGATQEYANTPDEIAFFMLSVGKTAQWQLTLKKD